jgi:hypothetical protein
MLVGPQNGTQVASIEGQQQFVYASVDASGTLQPTNYAVGKFNPAHIPGLSPGAAPSGNAGVIAAAAAEDNDDSEQASDMEGVHMYAWPRALAMPPVLAGGVVCIRRNVAPDPFHALRVRAGMEAAGEPSAVAPRSHVWHGEELRPDDKVERLPIHTSHTDGKWPPNRSGMAADSNTRLRPWW